MYKAVFIDIDGTLIKSDHSISLATIHVVEKLKENNILVVLVSARPLHSIIPIMEEIGLDGFPVASLNGACVSLNGNTVFDSKIDMKHRSCENTDNKCSIKIRLLDNS